MLRPRLISVRRRAAIHPDTRTAIQIDAHIRARKSGLSRRLSPRPIVRRPAAQIDAGIARHGQALRMKHRPEASGI